jgi:hypothetical protein
MKYLAALLFGLLMVGCAKKPKYDPNDIMIHFDANLDSLGGPQK